MKYITSAMFLVLFATSGCSTTSPCETVGMRIFFENGRSVGRENHWANVTIKGSDHPYWECPIPEVHMGKLILNGFPKNKVLILTLTYNGLNEEGRGRSDLKLSQEILAKDDLDVRIWWGSGSPPDPDILKYLEQDTIDFHLQISRKPRFEVSYGQDPVY